MFEQLKNSKGEKLYLFVKISTNNIKPYTKVCTWERSLENLNSFTTEVDNETLFSQLIHKEINTEFYRAEASMRQNFKGFGSDFFTYITIEPIYGDY